MCVLMNEGGHVLVIGIVRCMNECVCKNIYYVTDPQEMCDCGLLCN